MHVENGILEIFHISVSCQKDHEKFSGEFKYALSYLSFGVIDGLKTKILVQMI